MMFSALVILLASTMVSAQAVGPYVLKIPKCGLACIEKAVPQVCGPQGLLNYTCQCDSSAKISVLATPCIKATCTSQEQLDVLAETQQICEVVKADEIASSNSAAAKTMTGSKTMTSASATKSVIPFGQSGYALTSGPTSYVPSGNGAFAAATAVPYLGAGLAVLAFAAI